ncbi:sugar ABC transporter substrate-binding protein [candidate division KSB3 bacterium]|uniref:Sugar ABC transporter substrate-binding protein n=1 Tax=candidate division KSB3 bacterium TaxID=2044937 RepID=A0A2G6K8G0_9BACT|nr:MAG: sugar ABC transporter substrate-binding protein [candidate division KSB3 bacterium]
MKSTVLLVGLLVLLVCSFAYAEDVVLKYWMWDPNIQDMEQAIVDKFEEANPGIKVELTAIANPDYWTKMAAMAASKQMPDVLAMSSGYVQEFGLQGSLLDLTAYAERDFNKEDYFWGIMDKSFDVEGKIYAIPFAWVGTVLFYNKTLFDAAGQAYPDWGWTWDDFVSAAKALTKDSDGDGKTDVWGTLIYGRYATHDSWLFQNDADYLDPTKRKFMKTDSLVETISFLSDLVHTYKVAPNPKQYDLDSSGKKARVLFRNSQVAMLTEGTWRIDYFRNADPMEDEWDIAPVPRGPSWKEDTMYAWGDGLAIPATTEHPEEAWKFIKFLVDERPADQYFAGKVPFSTKEAFSEAWDDWTSKQQSPEHKTVILKFGKNPDNNVTTKFWSQWRGYGSAEESGITALLDSLYDGNIDVETFFEKSEKVTNRVLKRAYR